LKNQIRSIVNPSGEEWDELARLVSVRHLTKKETFVEAGRVCTHLGFIEKGLMRLYQWVNGEERTLNFYGEDEFISVMPSFQLQQPSKSTFEALTPVDLIVIAHDDLYGLFERHHVWERLGRLVAEKKLKEMNDLRDDFNYKTPTERYLYLTTRHPALLQHVPVQHIASYLGITRVHLTRLRRQLMSKH